MKAFLFIAIAAFFFVRCQNQPASRSSNSINEQPSAAKAVDTSAATDSVINVVLQNGTATVNLHLDSVGAQPVVLFSITNGKTLYAAVKRTAGAPNIRINQIQLPDKKRDGPFGTELTYPIQKFGTYGLLIGQNLMAEGAGKGDYTVTIRVEQ